MSLRAAKVVKHKTFTLCGTPEFLAPRSSSARLRRVDWGPSAAHLRNRGRPQPVRQPVRGRRGRRRNVLNAPLNFSSSFDPACRDLISRLLCRFLCSVLSGRRRQATMPTSLLQEAQHGRAARAARACRGASLKNNMDRSLAPSEAVAKPDSAEARPWPTARTGSMDYFNVQDDEDGGVNPPAAEADRRRRERRSPSSATPKQACGIDVPGVLARLPAAWRRWELASRRCPCDAFCSVRARGAAVESGPENGPRVVIRRAIRASAAPRRARHPG